MPLVSKSIQDDLRSQIGEAFSLGIQNFGKDTISKWLIRPGMEFASPLIWWGDVNKTRFDSYGGGPHEGLDFALAQKAETGLNQAGLEGLRVTALLDGKALWCFQDLVGDTLIVLSDYHYQGYRFIIQYSHIDFENAQIGDRLSQGEDIGKIKRSQNPKSITASHLHISTALIDEKRIELPDSDVSFENWLEWDKDGSLIYLDPLSLLSWEVKSERFLIGEEAQSPIARLVSTGATKEERIQLRRALCRSFPGIQNISAKTIQDANFHLGPRCILTSCEQGDWKIEYTDPLSTPIGAKLSGHGFESLIETLTHIEHANSTTP